MERLVGPRALPSRMIVNWEILSGWVQPRRRSLATEKGQAGWSALADHKSAGSNAKPDRGALTEIQAGLRYRTEMVAGRSGNGCISHGAALTVCGICNHQAKPAVWLQNKVSVLSTRRWTTSPIPAVPVDWPRMPMLWIREITRKYRRSIGSRSVNPQTGRNDLPAMSRPACARVGGQARVSSFAGHPAAPVV